MVIVAGSRSPPIASLKAALSSTLAIFSALPAPLVSLRFKGAVTLEPAGLSFRTLGAEPEFFFFFPTLGFRSGALEPCCFGLASRLTAALGGFPESVLGRLGRGLSEPPSSLLELVSERHTSSLGVSRSGCLGCCSLPLRPLPRPL